jgi:hypothetical protein
MFSKLRAVRTNSPSIRQGSWVPARGLGSLAVGMRMYGEVYGHAMLNK